MTFKRLMMLLAAVIATSLLVVGIVAFASMQRLNAYQQTASQEAFFYTAGVNEARQSQVDFQRQVQEWKNVLVRGNDREQYDRYFSSFEGYEAKVQSNLGSLDTRLRGHGTEMKEIGVLLDEHKKLGAKYREALLTWEGADPETGKKVDKLLRGIDRPASAAMDAMAKKIEEVANEKLSQTQKDAESFATEVKSVFAVAALVLLAIALTLCWKISRIVLGKVGAEPAELEALFQKVAKGDLTASIVLAKGDKTSVAAQSQLMITRVRSMVRALKNNAQEVMVSSDQAPLGSDQSVIQAALRNTKLGVQGLEAALHRFKA